MLRIKHNLMQLVRKIAFPLAVWRRLMSSSRSEYLSFLCFHLGLLFFAQLSFLMSLCPTETFVGMSVQHGSYSSLVLRIQDRCTRQNSETLFPISLQLQIMISNEIWGLNMGDSSRAIEEAKRLVLLFLSTDF